MSSDLARRPELGATVLRVALGAMWIAHAALKWFVFTVPGFAGWLASQGIPAAFAWPVFLAELLGGLAILTGFHGRWASLALTPVMLAAMATHLPNGWVHTSTGGGWEYPLFLALAGVAHFLMGDGAFALSSRRQPVVAVRYAGARHA